MKRFNKLTLLSLLSGAMILGSCDKNNTPNDSFDTSGVYTQNDQMARPAINTVFVNAARKNEFNTTTPSAMNAAFNAQFQSVLTGFGYTSNALGMDKATFTNVLVTDVLNVKTSAMNNTANRKYLFLYSRRGISKKLVRYTISARSATFIKVIVHPLPAG